MRREHGQTTIEYAVITALIGLVFLMSIGGYGKIITFQAAGIRDSMCDKSTWDCKTGILLHPCQPGSIGSACDAYWVAHPEQVH